MARLGTEFVEVFWETSPFARVGTEFVEVFAEDISSMPIPTDITAGLSGSGDLSATLNPVRPPLEWTDGLAPRAVASSISGEFDYVEMGPDVDADQVLQGLLTPTTMSSLDDESGVWASIYFKTDGATQDSGNFWEVHVFSDGYDFSEGYVARVPIGYGNLTLHRYTGGTYGAALGTWPVTVGDGVDGEYHRVDFVVKRSASDTRLRVYVDGDPSPVYSDPVVAGRPAGVYGLVALTLLDFYTGRLMIPGLSFSER